MEWIEDENNRLNLNPPTQSIGSISKEQYLNEFEVKFRDSLKSLIEASWRREQENNRKYTIDKEILHHARFCMSKIENVEFGNNKLSEWDEHFKKVYRLAYISRLYSFFH